MYSGWLSNSNVKLSVIGLGYVGLPLAVAFSNHYAVTGYDVSLDVILNYSKGIDSTFEVGNKVLSESKILFTNKIDDLANSNVFIITVPTPINLDRTPDISYLVKASETVGKYLTKDCLVIYESTVYPGLTEEVCIPILEKLSGLKLNSDFKVGYSPERINPGDKTHRLENIVKVVSGSDEMALEFVAELYQKIIKAGIFKAKSIKVAEAAKVIENTQRDLNIAFVNELSMIFDELNINTNDVLEAAKTKWNFLDFKPGLVGGHCIGVDPYYLTYKAQLHGLFPEIILAGRSINDNMGKYVAKNVIKLVIKNNITLDTLNIGIIGFTFKENCPDIRNSKVIDIVKELIEYGIPVKVYDPIANFEEVEREYSLRLSSLGEMKNLNVVIAAVAHDEFKNSSFLSSFFDDKLHKKILIDLKSIFYDLSKDEEYIYWSL